MNLDELTLGQIKQIQTMCGGGASHPYEVGKAYLVQTVTQYRVGKLVQVTDQELVLEGGGWMADTGRFNECIASGKYSEFEPVGDRRHIIGRGAIVAVDEWSHILPEDVK